MQMKVLFGCFTWKAIWCGENLILLPLVTFNSTVKKWPEVLQPNRSGVPSKLLFSILIQEISGIDFLIFAYNLRSGPMHFSRLLLCSNVNNLLRNQEVKLVFLLCLVLKRHARNYPVDYYFGELQSV